MSKVRAHPSFVLVQGFCERHRVFLEGGLIESLNGSSGTFSAPDGYTDERALLMSLLKKKRLHLSLDELQEVVCMELSDQLIQKMQKTIQPGVNESLRGIARRYVKHYGDDALRLSPLLGMALILSGRRDDFLKVRAEISTTIKNAKLENFEKTLLSPKIPPTSIPELLTMPPADFEAFIGTALSRKGYIIEQTQVTRDQGADLIISRLGVRGVVQVKRYAGAVGNEAIQQVVAAKGHYSAHFAWVITTGVFTKSAVELADSNEVVLVDGEELIILIRSLG